MCAVSDERRGSSTVFVGWVGLPVRAAGPLLALLTFGRFSAARDAESLTNSFAA